LNLDVLALAINIEVVLVASVVFVALVMLIHSGGRNAVVSLYPALFVTPAATDMAAVVCICVMVCCVREEIM
jgi:hypothetical protein